MRTQHSDSDQQPDLESLLTIVNSTVLGRIDREFVTFDGENVWVGHRAVSGTFLVQFLGCTHVAAEMALKMYRHTLMHGANPRILKRGDREIAWLVHWGEPWIARSMNLTTHTSGSLEVIHVSVEALVDNVRAVAKERFGVWRLDPGARDRVEAVERRITTW